MEQRIYKSFQELYRSKVSPGTNEYIQFTPEILAYISSVAFSCNNDFTDNGRPAERELRNLALLSAPDILKTVWSCLDSSYCKSDDYHLPFYTSNYAKNIGLMLLSRTRSKFARYKSLSPGTVVFPTFIDPTAHYIKELNYPDTDASIGIVLDKQGRKVLVLWDRHEYAIACNESDLISVNFEFTQEELDGIWTTFKDCDVWQSKVRPLCPQLSKGAEIAKKQNDFIKEQLIPNNNELQTEASPSGCGEQKGQANRSILQTRGTSMEGGYSGNVYCPGQCQGQARSSTVEGTPQKFGRPRSETRSALTGDGPEGITGRVHGTVRGTDERRTYAPPSDAVSAEVFECPECGENSMFCTRGHTVHHSAFYECVNEDCGHTENNP